MLSVAYKLRQVSKKNSSSYLFLIKIQPINLFVASADHRYGPITTIRQGNGQVSKHLTWRAFTFSENDWARVQEACEILEVSLECMSVRTVRTLTVYSGLQQNPANILCRKAANLVASPTCDRRAPNGLGSQTR
jgi:hypothetical protein